MKFVIKARESRYDKQRMTFIMIFYKARIVCLCVF